MVCWEFVLVRLAYVCFEPKALWRNPRCWVSSWGSICGLSTSSGWEVAVYFVCFVGMRKQILASQRLSGRWWSLLCNQLRLITQITISRDRCSQLSLDSSCFWIETWLILPVVICLSQRLSHACLSVNNSYETANGSLNQLSFIWWSFTTWITVVILELIHAKRPDFWKGCIY